MLFTISKRKVLGDRVLRCFYRKNISTTVSVSKLNHLQTGDQRSTDSRYPYEAKNFLDLYEATVMTWIDGWIWWMYLLDVSDGCSWWMWFTSSCDWIEAFFGKKFWHSTVFFHQRYCWWKKSSTLDSRCFSKRPSWFRYFFWFMTSHVFSSIIYIQYRYIFIQLHITYMQYI